MKTIIICISFLLLFKVDGYSQVKLNNKYRNLKITSLDGKVNVRCDVIKVLNNKQEIALGQTSEDGRYVIEPQCDQGDVYCFRPGSRNYNQVKHGCAIDKKQILIPTKKELLTLESNRYLGRFAVENSYYALSACATFQLMSFESGPGRDVLVDEMKTSLARFLEGPTASKEILTKERIVELQKQLNLPGTGEIDSAVVFGILPPDTGKIFQRNFTAEVVGKRDWDDRYEQNLRFGAYYYLQYEGDAQQALQLIKVAVDRNGSDYKSLYTMSLIQKSLGDKVAASQTAALSLSLAEKKGEASYIKLNKELLNSLH